MKKNHSSITQTLAMLCLAIFALCVLLVLLTAGTAYRRLVDRGEEAYTRRTAVQYLTTRIRQAETVAVGDWAGSDMLVLGETLDGESYTTRVYCCEGWLRELYGVPGAQLPPTAGQTLLEAEQLELKLEEDLLTVTLDGETLYLFLPAGRKVGQ